ncbi:MAG: AI-2E family transporter [Burkholderiales bacterium]|nr:AI-2E family transporter [Burkholderiales bacterium]
MPRTFAIRGQVPLNPQSEEALLVSETRADTRPQERVLLHMPVDVRSVSLAFIAVVAGIFAMYWAKGVLVPLLFGVMMSYALTPLVDRLERWWIPRVAGATLVLTALAAAFALTAWSLRDEAQQLIDTLPEVTQKLRQLTPGKGTSLSAIDKVQAAAADIETVAQAGMEPAVASTPKRRPTRVIIEKPAFDVRPYVLSGTLGIFVFLSQTAVAFCVALFLLSSANSFRRKMVKLAGPQLSRKKVTVETLNEISQQIQRYLLVQVGISVLVGLSTGIVFHLLGLNQASMWGVVAGVTNLVPYVGAVLVGGGSALLGLVQFESIEMALVIGGSSFAIHAVFGNLLAPWWMGRASRMSPFVVFVAVLAFGWLWGISGLLLGVPILLVVKAVCDRVDDLKPIGELLGA